MTGFSVPPASCAHGDVSVSRALKQLLFLVGVLWWMHRCGFGSEVFIPPESNHPSIAPPPGFNPPYTRFFFNSRSQSSFVKGNKNHLMMSNTIFDLNLNNTMGMLLIGLIFDTM